MSKLKFFEHFLRVGKCQAQTQVVFQAKTQAKFFPLNWAPDATNEHEVLPSMLQELELRVVPAANCTNIYRKLLGEEESLDPTFNILESQICAEGLSLGKDSCNGDSGGPVMSLNSEFQYVARGVVSYGGPKCNSEYPGVYTRVSKYLGWIDSVINGQ